MGIKRQPKCWGAKINVLLWPNVYEKNYQFEIDVLLWSIGTLNQFVFLLYDQKGTLAQCSAVSVRPFIDKNLGEGQGASNYYTVESNNFCSHGCERAKF